MSPSALHRAGPRCRMTDWRGRKLHFIAIGGRGHERAGARSAIGSGHG